MLNVIDIPPMSGYARQGTGANRTQTYEVSEDFGSLTVRREIRIVPCRQLWHNADWDAKKPGKSEVAGLL
jgi:hypothetical protein